MIIVLQCILGQFHDLLHVMRGTIEGPRVQGKMVGVLVLQEIMHRAGHQVRGVTIAVLQDLGHDPTGRIFSFCIIHDRLWYELVLIYILVPSKARPTIIIGRARDDSTY